MLLPAGRRPIAAGLLLLLTLALVASPAAALVERLQLTHDTRAAFHIQSFGFERGGVFRLELNGLERRVPEGTAVKEDGYEVAFVLQRSDSDAPVRLSAGATTSGSATTTSVDKIRLPPAATQQQQQQADAGGEAVQASTGAGAEGDIGLSVSKLLDTCFHRQPLEGGADANLILRLDRRDAWDHLVYERAISVPGFYHLYFSNCEPHNSISLRVDLTEYNLNADGSRMYLSAGERYLPTVLVVLCTLFLIELSAWSLYLAKHLSYVKTIHWLMLVTVLVKAASIAVEAMKFHSLKASGVHDGWTTAYYIVASLKGMLLFCVIVLLATGWSYLKPFLTERDRIILLITVTVQALVNLASVVVGELQQGSRTWLTWHDLLSILDMLCWCAILLPIVWSIRSLREQAREDERRGERAARNMLRLQSFRSFYLLVISFVYFTRIVVFLLAIMLPFEQTWLATVFAEAAALAFYAATGFLFRPVGSNPYLPLEMDETEMAEMEREHEDEMDEQLNEQEKRAQQQA